jgi:hypothetical protein
VFDGNPPPETLEDVLEEEPEEPQVPQAPQQ